MIDRTELANEVVMVSVKLLRWLRAADAAPLLTGPQTSALGVVIHSGRIRMSDLARLEEVSRPTITSTAGQLLDLGLISREADSEDGRVTWLRATDNGLKVFSEGQTRRIAPLADSLSGVSEADQLILLEASRLLTTLLPPLPRSQETKEPLDSRPQHC